MSDPADLGTMARLVEPQLVDPKYLRLELGWEDPEEGPGFASFTICTSNDGPSDVSETLAAIGSSDRDLNTTTDASNASAMMISDAFIAVFIPTMMAADRGGDQA